MGRTEFSNPNRLVFPTIVRLNLTEFSCAVVSEQGALLEFTESFASLFSIEIPASVGKSIFDLFLLRDDSRKSLEEYVKGIFGDHAGQSRIFVFPKPSGDISIRLMGFGIGNGKGILFAEEQLPAKHAIVHFGEGDCDFHLSADSIPLGFCVHSGGKVLYVNSAALQIFGAKSRDELRGKNVIDFVHPDYRGKVAERIKKTKQDNGEMPLIEEKFIRVDGSFIDVEVFGTHIDYKGEPAVLVLFRESENRKTMEERLFESEKKYRELFDSMLDAFAFHKMIFDENGAPVDYIFLEMNPAFVVMTGFRVEDLVGKRVLEVLPGTEKSWIEIYGKVASTGESVRFENYAATIGKHLEVTAYSSAKGYFASIFRDITVQKLTEQALKNERDLLDRFMELSPVALTVVDGTGKIIYANHSAEEVLGLSRESIESRTYNAPEWKILAMDGSRLLENEIPVAKVMATKQPVRNIRHQIELTSGEKRYLSVNGAPILNSDHEVEKVVLSIDDITDSYRGERALNQIIEASSLTGGEFFNSMVLGFSEIFDIDYVMIAELTAPGETRVHTLAYCLRNKIIENFEYDLKDTPCEYVLEKKFCIYPDEIRKFYPKAKMIQELEIEGYGGISLYSSKSKPIGILVVMNTKPITQVGMIERFVKLFASRISNEIERLHIEEEREKIEEQLRQAQKMESIGRLAGGIAHDFNNMLTPIIGYADMFLNYELTPDHSFYAPMKDLYDAAIRAKNLTHQLLAFSRKQMLILKKIDINDVINSFYSMLRRTIRENIDIKFFPENGLWSIEADSSQIEQILLNLCVNSQDAIRDRGAITIETKNSDIEKDVLFGSDVLNAGKYVLLRITDNGEGIDEPSMKLIFEPFFTTKKEFGTGLGLATVYGIVKQHNGHIEVESVKDRGTIFSIYFSRADTAFDLGSEADGQGMIPVIPNAGDITILVVEDDNNVRKLTESILKKCGFKILVAEDGASAMKIFGEFRDSIGLLLTDLIMPDMTGKELYTSIKEYKPDMKVLFMSGYSGNLLNAHGFKADEQFYIQKPFSMNQLVEKIRKII